jgi:mRNA interferase HicA
VKRRDLIIKLEAEARRRGEKLEITEGSKHTKVKIGDSVSVVPRHNEINEITAKAILKQMGAK